MATNGEFWQLIGPQSLEARRPEGRGFPTLVQCPCQRPVEMGESIKIISIHSNRFRIDIVSQNWIWLVTRSAISLTTFRNKPKTRLPSNLRQATRKCVYSRHDHFRSRNKDGGHNNRSAVAVKSHAARKLRSPVFCGTGVIAYRSVTMRKYGTSRFFATVTLTLTQ